MWGGAKGKQVEMWALAVAHEEEPGGHRSLARVCPPGLSTLTQIPILNRKWEKLFSYGFITWEMYPKLSYSVCPWPDLTLFHPISTNIISVYVALSRKALNSLQLLFTGTKRREHINLISPSLLRLLRVFTDWLHFTVHEMMVIM